MYHYTDCGLDYIYLTNGYEITHDPEWGECISIHNLDGLNRQIAKDIVNNAPTIRGQEIRFFRSELELTQTQMAVLLGTDLRTVQRWESEKKLTPIPPMADKLIRLFYTAHEEGDKAAKDIRNSLKKVRELTDNEKERIKNHRSAPSQLDNINFFNGLSLSENSNKEWQSDIRI